LTALILTHHKCATVFVGTYLKKFCELNAFDIFHSHHGDAKPQDDIPISFFTNAAFNHSITSECLHIIRNPLDIIVSAYYSHRLTHPLYDWSLLESQRKILQQCDKDAGFYLTLSFLELSEFYPKTPGPLHGLRHWDFDHPNIQTVRMEDLIANVDLALGQFLRSKFGDSIAIPDKSEFTFEHMTGGRHAGEIDDSSHYREGQPGTWRRELPKPIVAYVRAHFADLLGRFYPEALQ
jgi:hypothetical protein